MDHAAHRIAQHQLDQPPRRAVGAHHPELLETVQARLDLAAGVQVEGDAVDPDPVEIALEDRRHPVPPHRKAQHQRIGGAQPLDMAARPPTGRDAGVLCARRSAGCHHRVEAHGVEVAIVDLVPGLAPAPRPPPGAARAAKLSASGWAKITSTRIRVSSDPAAKTHASIAAKSHGGGKPCAGWSSPAIASSN